MIVQINPAMDYVQVRGILLNMEIVGEKRARRLVAHLRDASGIIELTWFQGINWVEKALVIGQEYLVFGKPGFFLGKPQITHPEMETVREANAAGKGFLEPISGNRKTESKGLECQGYWQIDAAAFFGA
jgi:ATP-dependent DNA helicase RecG